MPSSFTTMSNISQQVIARRQFNKQQLISRLPFELMSSIITLAATFQGRESYEWIKILHVCYAWYEIGLNSALLWSTLTHTGGPECMQTMLQRSRNSALSVFFVCLRYDFFDILGGGPSALAVRGRMSRSNQVSRDLLLQMPRIKHLVVKAGDNFWEDLDAHPPPSQLTTLELTFLASYSYHPSRAFHADEDWIFASPLPTLRELKMDLEIRGCGVIRASALRVLHVKAMQGSWGMYEARDLLESMRQMPLLEEVLLHYPLLTDTDEEQLDDIFNMEVVRLPNVKSFSFVDRDHVFTRFLRCVAIPAATQLTLGCDVVGPAGAESAVASFREKIGEARLNEQQPIRTLSVQTCVGGGNERERSVRFEGCAHGRRDDCIHSSTGWCKRATVSLTLAYVTPADDHEWDRLDGFSGTLKLLPLSDVEELHIKSLDVYNTLKAHVGLLASDKVAGVAGPELPQDVHRFTVPTAPGEIPCELEAGLLGLMPNLKAICLDLAPQRRVLGETVTTDLGQGHMALPPVGQEDVELDQEDVELDQEDVVSDMDDDWLEGGAFPDY
ncbi:hypothetical protein PHLGIDRAFT_176248 [Phlebiopsis gigantea 11061_1 CR5-6]|uniref:F-box domain-containing protein n=1 Tax=Phlebiopsis gigantea (strain 11061_1 CR5-6) TaxID=745531 RepID=A0A0C3RUW7_PHLG1|nr:hypothetical protein PHLGIDRAFT_176248 [Phlebiopsis gigantea 11061_1 CR5-6]